MLTKKDILSKPLRYEDVTVDEWGGVVRIGEMTAGAYDRYQQSLYTLDDKGKFKQDLTDMTASYVRACLINEDGTLMFTLDEVKRLPANPITRLYDVAQRVNGEGKKAKEDIAKNSGGGQAG